MTFDSESGKAPLDPKPTRRNPCLVDLRDLPVAELAKSNAHYEAIGSVNQPKFTDGTAACMVLSHTTFIMLTHDKFSYVISSRIADAHSGAKLLLVISQESREAVDDHRQGGRSRLMRGATSKCRGVRRCARLTAISSARQPIELRDMFKVPVPGCPAGDANVSIGPLFEGAVEAPGWHDETAARMNPRKRRTAFRAKALLMARRRNAIGFDLGFA
jgi:predicted lactoylglutathione lyase